MYAQPLGYWKNYYNLFDFAVLVVSVMHEILMGVELGGSGVTFLRMAAGELLQPLGASTLAMCIQSL